jgi:hypothetical protein
MRTMTLDDLRDLLGYAHRILTAVAAGRCDASGDIWTCAVDRAELCGIDCRVTRDAAGARLLVERIEASHPEAIG